jgi:hypothetical protein
MLQQPRTWQGKMRIDRKLHGDKRAGLKEKWDIVYGTGLAILTPW